MPTVYDGLFPDGTLLTAPTRSKPKSPASERADGPVPNAGDDHR
jgi:hypothetical protein